MLKRAAALAMMLGSACGGESKHGATAAAGGSAGESAAGGAEVQAGRGFIPDASNAPAAAEDRLEGGSFEGSSFEGSLGSGWDFCRSKHAGATPMEGSDRSSHGARWLAFDSLA